MLTFRNGYKGVDKMNTITKKDFHGIQVAFEGKEKISLTDLWKASGEDVARDPRHWLESIPNQEFINNVAKSLNVGISCIIKTKRGKGGGTWGHWQIALEYARYLSPELAIWTNQVVKERLEEERSPELAYSRGRERAIKGWQKQGKSEQWIAVRLKSIDATKQNTKVLGCHGHDSKVFPMCADATNVAIIGMKAKEFKAVNNLPVSASTRDHLSEIQLLEIALTNAVSAQRIEEQDVYGNERCADVHSIVGKRVANAVNMRGI
jgi:hypothetical protein